jgi:pyrroline-5-carboxylate reductase
MFFRKIIVYQLGVIGGTGWMGTAMLRSSFDKSVFTPSQVALSNRDGALLAGFPHVAVFLDSQVMTDQSDCIVLSVRPQHFSNLKLNISPDKLVISIMAGVSTEKIREATGANSIIRAMPNAAAEVGKSYTPYFASDRVSTRQRVFAESFFKSFGCCDRVAKEDDLNYFVALTGSGHGSMAFFAQALVDGAIAHGIDEFLAERAVRQLMRGVGQLIAEETNSPAMTVERVTTYDGTTCRLVETLKKEGVDSSIAKALNASYLRAKSDMTK